MKKLLSLILAFILAFSVISGLSVSAEEYDELFGLPEIKEGYYRYFLLAPENWFWDESVTVGIYWEEGTEAPTSWPGCKAHKADTDDIYYYDVPQDVEHIIWNNFYTGASMTSSITRYNKRTAVLTTKDAEHQISYNRMIAVVSGNSFSDTELSEDFLSCQWFSYYGNGEYGTKQTPEKSDTYRYYFYLPEKWENKYSTSVYIYWWSGTDAQAAYPGVKALKTNIEGLYYYDVPKDVENICWNNGVTFNEDIADNYEYVCACYPETNSMQNMVYVIDSCVQSEFKSVYYGQWYYYYGFGEYGLTQNKADGYYTCRSFNEENPAPKLETNRYYFYMPEEWENQLSEEAGIYWWEGSKFCTQWPGYKAKRTDVDGLYYYDVPKDVTTIIWNNYIDGGSFLYPAASRHTKNIGTEYYEPGESELYPEGLASFDEMVFVIDYDKTDYSSFETVLTGDWYYYYGNGEYGITPEKGDIVYTNRHFGTAPISLGDVNCDGNVSIKDATAIQKHLAKLQTITEENLRLADFNLDAQITIKDATAIQKHLAKL